MNMNGVIKFAEWCNARQDCPGMHASLDLYGINSLDAATALWNSLPTPTATLLQDKDLVTFTQVFYGNKCEWIQDDPKDPQHGRLAITTETEGFTVRWHMSRKYAAIPTIVDGEVVWVLQNQFTAQGVF